MTGSGRPTSATMSGSHGSKSGTTQTTYSTSTRTSGRPAGRAPEPPGERHDQPRSSRPGAGPGRPRRPCAGTDKVGMFEPFDLLERCQDQVAQFLALVAASCIDHVCCGDHVSFAGAGFDGLIQAAALAMLHPVLPVYTGVYLLPLRHTVLVARQLADIDRLAAGRLVFGVGVGGEDRHEVSNCGVDP